MVNPFLPPTLSDSPHPFRPPAAARGEARLENFYVITTVSNPNRYERRYDLYKRFEEMCRQAEVKLITVEQAFGLRQYMVTKPNDPMHVQVRTVEELWHKENMINIGIKRATEMGAREVAWVDADVRPAMVARDWFEETWHQLQHFEFVQMWEWMLDVSLNHNPIGGPQPSFMANYLFHGCPDYTQFLEIHNGRCQCPRCCPPNPDPDPYPYGGMRPAFGRPGLAWAANIESGLDRVGGLIDFCIHGSGDWYMAYALVGMLRVLRDEAPSDAYVRKLFRWQQLAERWIKRDIGLVRGTIIHDFHGAKKLRLYDSRDEILVNNHFDPDRDLKYDAQGLLQLETWEPRQIALRDQLRAYNRFRNDDSTSGGEN